MSIFQGSPKDDKQKNDNKSNDKKKEKWFYHENKIYQC
jgi:hypothetical protein